jgi:predicted transcriptional regulator
LLNHQENTSTRIANLLHAPRSKVSEWLKNYETYRVEGLFEGYRIGRIPSLSEKQLIDLGDIIDSDKIAYGHTS